MKRLVAALLLAVTACSKGALEDTAPAPASLPANATPTPAPTRTPTTAAGTYRMRVEIQSGNRPPEQQRNPRRVPPASLVLEAQTAAVPAMGAPAGQFNATVQLPGYSRAPRGRTGQAAAWWPIGRDSVVVQFSQGARGDVQLRGALNGTALQGEIWYVSMESGSTFQLGTFNATRVR